MTFRRWNLVNFNETEMRVVRAIEAELALIQRKPKAPSAPVRPDPQLYKEYNKSLDTARVVEAAIMEHRKWVLAQMKPKQYEGRSREMIDEEFFANNVCAPDGQGGCKHCSLKGRGELVRRGEW